MKMGKINKKANNKIVELIWLGILLRKKLIDQQEYIIISKLIEEKYKT